MEEMIFVVDESGAKGYSTNKEQYPGELGVAAGYMLPAQLLSKLRSNLDSVVAKYSTDGKLHITDLAPEDQESLRSEIFKLFISRQAPWVYESVYVDGLHGAVARSNAITEKFRQEITSSIKISARPEIELLHANIFCGAVIKAIAFLMDRGVSEFKVTIITDRVDDSVIDMFKDKIDEFLGFGSEKTHEVKGWDVENKKPVRKSYKTKVTVSEPWAIDLSKISYEIKVEDSSLTLAADVLVNSVHHNLRERQSRQLGLDLNSGDPLSEHPLRKFLYGIPSGNMPWLTDALYAHPERDDGT